MSIRFKRLYTAFCMGKHVRSRILRYVAQMERERKYSFGNNDRSED